MKKLVFVLIVLFCFFLIACNEKQDEGELNGESVDDKIDLENKYNLDNNQEQEVNVDVKTKDGEENIDNFKGDEIEMSDEKLIELAKQKFLELYIKPEMSNATIDDVRLVYYLGIYHNNLVGVFINKNAVFYDELCSIQVADFIFKYSWGYDILVFHNDNFYTLQQAYNDEYISQNDLCEIYRIYHTYERYE